LSHQKGKEWTVINIKHNDNANISRPEIACHNKTIQDSKKCPKSPLLACPENGKASLKENN
jgi:hypothetical protein